MGSLRRLKDSDGARAERERLGLVENAVAGKPVHRHLDVDAVPAPELDRLVDEREPAFVQVRPVVARREGAVVDRQAREIEPPFLQGLELPLREGPRHARIRGQPLGRGPEQPQKVEAAPARGRSPVPRGGAGGDVLRQAEARAAVAVAVDVLEEHREGADPDAALAVERAVHDDGLERLAVLRDGDEPVPLALEVDELASDEGLRILGRHAQTMRPGLRGAPAGSGSAA